MNSRITGCLGGGEVALPCLQSSFPTGHRPWSSCEIILSNCWSIQLFKTIFEEHAALFELPKPTDDEITQKEQSDEAEEVDGEDEISILPLEVEIVEETIVEEKPKTFGDGTLQNELYSIV